MVAGRKDRMNPEISDIAVTKTGARELFLVIALAAPDIIVSSCRS